MMNAQKLGEISDTTDFSFTSPARWSLRARASAAVLWTRFSRQEFFWPCGRPAGSRPSSNRLRRQVGGWRVSRYEKRRKGKAMFYWHSWKIITRAFMELFCTRAPSRSALPLQAVLAGELEAGVSALGALKYFFFLVKSPGRAAAGAAASPSPPSKEMKTEITECAV